MRIPDFLCVGAQKAGTTSLYEILKQHPDIFLPDIKELHFFDNEEHYSKGLEHYSNYFSNCENRQICGEITPNYMYLPNIPQKIYSSLGTDLKLIFMLRNPANRAFSHYKMRIARGQETKTFMQSIDLELIELTKTNYNLEHRYIHRGFYSDQIRRFLKFFDKKNMFFILFENDFICNTNQTFKNLFSFLEVKSLENIALNIQSNQGTSSKSEKINSLLNTANSINRIAKKIVPNKKIRVKLKNFFSKLNEKPTASNAELDEIKPFLINEIYKNSIIELENLIGRDLSSWYKIGNISNASKKY